MTEDTAFYTNNCILCEGFDFTGDDECDDYYAESTACNAILKEAVKDMDTWKVFIAVTGIVPPWGWKSRQDETNKFLGCGVYDKRVDKFAEELRKLGWTEIPYPLAYNDANLMVNGSPNGKSVDRAVQERWDEYLSVTGNLCESVLRYLGKDEHGVYEWRTLLVSPDNGLFFLSNFWTSNPNVIAPTGLVYYTLKNCKYDADFEEHVEKQKRQGFRFLRQYVLKSVKNFWDNDGFTPALDADGYPVMRLLGNQSHDTARLSAAAARRGVHTHEESRLRQYGLGGFYQNGMLGWHSDMMPSVLFVNSQQTMYCAMYFESDRPEVFKACRKKCGQSGVNFKTKDELDCTAIYEYGLLPDGVELYDSIVKNKKRR